MKSEKKNEVEKRRGSEGEGRLSFTAEAPSPPQPAGRGDEDAIDELVMMVKMTRVAWFKVK